MDNNEDINEAINYGATAIGLIFFVLFAIGMLI